jgi:hypothetical protein
MSAYLALKLAHLIAMVYWLGGDLGTYYSSRYVVDPRLSPAQRHIALKIMLGCDQGPKLCMPLIFAIGFTMAAQVGFIAVPVAVTVAVWVIALLWFANVNLLYFLQDAALKARLSRIDLGFRFVVVIGLLFAGIGALVGDSFIRADWLAAKFIVFAGLVACGIYIRLQLKPFASAFGQLMTQGSSPDVEATLSRSLARCRPPVYLIWAGIVLSAALGLHLIRF